MQASLSQISNATGNLVIALAGNPNAGKTTLFNFLTGLKQKVANYPGVTIEWRSGNWRLKERTVKVIDLPGLYSLETTSLDESIAREVISGASEGLSKPDVIVAVVDATNLERNLYLVTQLLEFDVPVVVALTMMDVFEKSGHAIDTRIISNRLGARVVAVKASEGIGSDELEHAV